jgi:hypothetical protein
MAASAPSGKRPRRASARLEARAESALPPLIRALAGDPLSAVLKLVDDADLPCARLVCKAFRGHSSPAQEMLREDFLRTRALAVFAWERMPGFVITEDAHGWSMLTIAASVGCAGVLAELVDNRQCELTAYACEAAAEKGHLDALAWLHSRGCPWGWTCREAACEGHLEVLRYAHVHDCPWDIDVCYFAARGGHLEVLRYAHENGCPWESSTCGNAAVGGHLEVLRYAHEHGCPLPPGALAAALHNGHAEVAEYLRAAQPAA